VAKYLMIKYEWTSHQALEKIQTKREIYLTPGVEEVLRFDLKIQSKEEGS
jgi:hypothetical protein